MTLESDGTYKIWNYWEPAGPWDYKPDGRTTKHWVGVHPNGGYYEDDTQGIVDAYEHGLVFTKADIDHLINTAKTSWAGGNPARPVAGMAISVQPATGTAKVLNACFPNSKTAEPASAGSGALSGKIVSVEWDAASENRQDRRAAQRPRRGPGYDRNGQGHEGSGPADVVRPGAL